MNPLSSYENIFCDIAEGQAGSDWDLADVETQTNIYILSIARILERRKGQLTDNLDFHQDSIFHSLKIGTKFGMKPPNKIRPKNAVSVFLYWHYPVIPQANDNNFPK